MAINPKYASNLVNRNDNEGLSTVFKVIIPGLPEISFKSCEGIQSEIEVVTFVEGGSQTAPRTARGQQRASRISFGQGSTHSGGKSIYDWYSDVVDPGKPLAKKTFSITIRAPQKEREIIAEWWVLNAWPCQWMAPLMSKEVNQITIDYITFAHEGIRRK